MKCPKCKQQESSVIDSRYIKRKNGIRRRRSCNNCEYRFTTYEHINSFQIMVIKKSNYREEFDIKKIEKSFHIACKKRPVSEELIQKILSQIEEKIHKQYSLEIPSSIIGQMVMDTLVNIDEVAFIRYASVYRQFDDLSQFKKQIKDIEK